jgi:hypothetical protein
VVSEFFGVAIDDQPIDSKDESRCTRCIEHHLPTIAARQKSQDGREQCKPSNTHGAPLATARLREAEEPCWELAAVFKASAGEPLIPVARAFLDLLKLPAVAT